MRRFHFPFERALSYKTRRERLAEFAQLRALGDKLRRDAEVERLRRLIDETAALLHGQMGKPVNPVTWFATLSHSEQLGRQLKAAQAEARKAEDALAQARERYRKAAQEAEILRTLRQQEHQRFLEAAAKAEQVLLDEMSLAPWRGEQGTEGGGAS